MGPPSIVTTDDPPAERFPPTYKVGQVENGRRRRCRQHPAAVKHASERARLRRLSNRQEDGVTVITQLGDQLITRQTPKPEVPPTTLRSGSFVGSVTMGSPSPHRTAGAARAGPASL